ncbi:acetate kinase [Oscillatoria acuminata]|uniref:Acetate kinase n=1 Tax=Oscillatoria acuminata PCC 6304 TaxID=56110 RepID=K9TSH2_9CYAN|nr:acetate kinase [Oscillatoria acuminata]AFY85136.1 acetate kinase [Oscillatoria acuminata PCC 6304]
MKILVLNAGSSTQKNYLYELEKGPLNEMSPPLWSGKIDWSRQEGMAEIEVKSGNQKLAETRPSESREKAIASLLETLWQGKTQAIADPSEIDVVGHRIVHGGEKYREATLITPEVKSAIAHLAKLAPAHNSANLQGIEAVEKILPNVPQIAVFDTAFHADLPLETVVYPLPYEWYQQGIRRYGFHGISYQYATQRTADLLGKPLESLRMIVCHLGNGCSLAAIKNGKSVETTMGFTPLEGLMMGTRSGSIDPGILIHQMRSQQFTVDELDSILNRESGLKGVSGVSSDMRDIHTAIEEGNERAKLAFDMYVHRLRLQIGAMLPILGGLDVLVFTGGVGENQSSVRSGACEGFEFLKLHLDPHKNQNSPTDADIATIESQVRVFVIQAQEDWAIARECWHSLTKNQSYTQSSF